MRRDRGAASVAEHALQCTMYIDATIAVVDTCWSHSEFWERFRNEISEALRDMRSALIKAAAEDHLSTPHSYDRFIEIIGWLSDELHELSQAGNITGEAELRGVFDVLFYAHQMDVAGIEWAFGELVRATVSNIPYASVRSARGRRRTRP